MTERRSADLLAAWALIFCICACALPLDTLTGIEISWSMQEQERGGANEDGDDGDSDEAGSGRLRTCAGALLRRVELRVEDLDDPERASTFSYGCALGHTSDVYVDLRPGSYLLTTRAISDLDGAVHEIEESLEIGESDVSRVLVDLSPPLAPWTLEIDGATSCSLAAASLRYAEPADDLVEPEETATTARYRETLLGDGGLSLDGTPIPCDGPWAQVQRFELDPGRYLLDLEVDDRACALPLVIPFAGATTTLDLANLPCDG